MTSLERAFGSFSELLKDRLLSGVFTTEDSVRYLFFHSVTENMRVLPNEILLESPHPRYSKKEIDMIIAPSDSRPECVFEFKFHRQIPSGKNVPRPQHAGDMFKDIFRLANYKVVMDDSRCFFVYATGSEMKSYLNNRRNNLTDFFNLSLGCMLDINEEYIKRHAETMIKRSGKVTDCRVRMCLLEDFDGFAARIFEVLR